MTIHCRLGFMLLTFMVITQGTLFTGCVGNKPHCASPGAASSAALPGTASAGAAGSVMPTGTAREADLPLEADGSKAFGTLREGVPQPPHHVIVAQGPTDPVQRYALVTWDRNDARVTGYEVLRDGLSIGTVLFKDEPWSDTSFTDRTVTPGIHRYTVRAVANGIKGGESAPYRVRIRTDADFGKVYKVDSFRGSTDSEKINRAIAAATSAGGGVVQLSARTYRLSGSSSAPAIDVDGDNIVIRGAGINQTILQPDYPGWEGASECPGARQIVRFKGTLAPLSTRLAGPIMPGDRKVVVDSGRGLEIGQVILFSQAHAESEPDAFVAKGVRFDPGTGRDDRYPHESNEIVDIRGTDVTFKYPFSYGFTASIPWQVYRRGMHNGIELLTIQGRSEDEQTYYDALTLNGADNYAAEIEVQWTNRRLARISGHNLRLVGFRGPYGGPKGMLRKICRYKVQVHRASNVLILGATMGRKSDDHNLSLVTIQQAVRVVVRNSRFFRSRTYAVNEHGEGSRHLLVENNQFSVGDTAQQAILLGNNTWGFSGPVIIRNNLFESNPQDIRVGENSYEVRILDNVSRGVGQYFLVGFGWAGPFTGPDLFGSMRMTVARNRVLHGAAGIRLGSKDGIYPYPGVRDIAIFDNILQAKGSAITILEDGTKTGRIRVFGNKGYGDSVRPDLADGDCRTGNEDGRTIGSAPQPADWTKENFAWEEFDRY